MVEPRLSNGARIIAKLLACPVELINPGFSQSVNLQFSHHSYLPENDDIPE